MASLARVARGWKGVVGRVRGGVSGVRVKEVGGKVGEWVGNFDLGEVWQKIEERVEEFWDGIMFEEDD